MRVKTPGMKADSESTTVAVSWPDIMLTPRNCQSVRDRVNNVRRPGANFTCGVISRTQNPSCERTYRCKAA